MIKGIKKFAESKGIKINEITENLISFDGEYFNLFFDSRSEMVDLETKERVILSNSMFIEEFNSFSLIQRQLEEYLRKILTKGKRCSISHT
jgi:hypothetical protein